MRRGEQVVQYEPLCTVRSNCVSFLDSLSGQTSLELATTTRKQSGMLLISSCWGRPSCNLLDLSSQQLGCLLGRSIRGIFLSFDGYSHIFRENDSILFRVCSENEKNVKIRRWMMAKNSPNHAKEDLHCPFCKTLPAGDQRDPDFPPKESKGVPSRET